MEMIQFLCFWIILVPAAILLAQYCNRWLNHYDYQLHPERYRAIADAAPDFDPDSVVLEIIYTPKQGTKVNNTINPD